jgi:hypothetical protein
MLDCLPTMGLGGLNFSELGINNFQGFSFSGAAMGSLKSFESAHSEDKAALKAYLERRNLQALPIIANVKDSDFDDKLRTAITQKLESPAII